MSGLSGNHEYHPLLHNIEEVINMNTDAVIAFIFGLILLLLIVKVLSKPLKFVLKLVLNTMIGGIILFGLNYLSPWTGFHLPLNMYTAVFVGILGVPGIIALFFMKLWFY